MGPLRRIVVIVALCCIGRHFVDGFIPFHILETSALVHRTPSFSLQLSSLQYTIGGKVRCKLGSASCLKAMERDVSSNPSDRSIYAYYMATCVPGMALALSNELRELGCSDVEMSGNSAVYFHVYRPETILQVLLWSRTAHKVLELLCRTSEPVHSRDDIYQWIRRTVPVEDLLLNPVRNGRKQSWFTLSVSVTLNNAAFIPSDINHSHYTALNIKNALVDAAREVSNNDHLESDRPSVDVTDACDVPLVVMLRGIKSTSFDRSRFEDDPSPDTLSAGAQVSLFRCIHGVGSLHRRGYRNNISMHKASLKESTAAGLLYTAGWHTKCQHGPALLMDPMMGSGTFLLEGAMMAADLAPGLMRIKCGVPGAQSPPILRWNSESTDASLQSIWNKALIDATKRAQRGIESFRERGIRIVGNDMHDASYELADRTFGQAGLRQLVQFHCSDCADWRPTVGDAELPWTIVTNPPWGVRLNDEMSTSWEALRVFLRDEKSVVPKNGSEVWILSGNANATKHLGLRRSQSIPLQTGDQNLRWLQYILREPGSFSDERKSTTTVYANENAGTVPYNRRSNNHDDDWVDRNEHWRSERTDDPRRLTVRSDGRGERSRRPYSNNAADLMSSNKRQQPPSRPGRTNQAPRPKKPKAAALKNSENEWLI
jgi:putative N6-adenine-specific DNA methylase